MKTLEGKTALITGVGRRTGIGYALCKALSDEGANIFYTYFNGYDRKLGLLGAQEDARIFAPDFGPAEKVACTEIDLRSSHAPTDLFMAAVQKFGSVDILINNACVSHTEDFLAITSETLDEHYAVNVRATTLLCQVFVAHFKKQTGGRIINMTSGQSISIMPNEIAYTITKASLEMLTLQLAPLLRERGITINAVDPGPTDTGWISDALRVQLENEMGIATPDEAASAVLTFLSGEREGVTGSVLHVAEERMRA